MSERGLIPLPTVETPYSMGDYAPLPSAQLPQGTQTLPRQKQPSLSLRQEYPVPTNTHQTHISPAGRGNAASPTLTPNSKHDGDRATAYGRPWTSPSPHRLTPRPYHLQRPSLTAVLFSVSFPLSYGSSRQRSESGSQSPSALILLFKNNIRLSPLLAHRVSRELS